MFKLKRRIPTVGAAIASFQSALDGLRAAQAHHEAIATDLFAKADDLANQAEESEAEAARAAALVQSFSELLQVPDHANV